jgi:NAD/NADP transhydrogenase beta subunit
LFQDFWLLLPIAGFAAALFLVSLSLTRHKPKSITSDLAAVVGLTMTAPAAMYVLTGRLQTDTLLVWLLNVLFFGSSVFYVHMKIRATGLKKEMLTWRERLLIGHLNILYHLAVLIILTTLVQANHTPALAFVAFVPVSLHAFIGTMRLSSRVGFKKLGFLLLGQSLVFAILISLTFVGS